jgi:parallel beta-helix repeat protein
MNNIFSNTIKTPNQVYSFGGNIWGASNLMDGGPFGDNCITANPQFIDSDPFYGIKPTSPAVGAGAKTKTLGGILMTAPLTDRAGAIRPNPSWSSPDLGATESPFALPGISVIIRVPQDQSTIQKGINAASTGNVVLVSEGTYKENIVLRKKITLTSFLLIDKDTTHISKTIIDGSTPTNPDSGSVISIQNADTTLMITGFTITKGSGNKHVGPYWNPSATARTCGGIEMNGGGMTIRNNIITGNTINVLPPATEGWAGGIGVYDIDVPGSTTYSIIESNVVSNNSIIGGTENGGGGLDMIGSGRIINNTILGNSCMVSVNGLGQSIASKKDTAFVENNLIQGNSVSLVSGFAIGGSGMTAYFRNNVIINNSSTSSPSYICWTGDNSTTVFERNYIAKNGGLQHGIVLRTGAKSLIRNNIIVNNSGTGIFVDTLTTATIINNTIASNSRYGISTRAPSYLLNNILWNNTLGSIGINTSGKFFTAYNLIGGGYAGTGNIDADPKFRVDDSLYHFLGGSLCNSGGVPTASVGGVTLNAPAYDYFGDPRPMPNFPGARPDIGAVEMPFNPNPGDVRDLGIGLPMEFSLSQNYPNPFNPSTTIRYALPSSAHVRLTIYDMLGREVETLINEEQSAGWKEVEWNAGAQSSGIYFYTIQAGANIETKKLMLLK